MFKKASEIVRGDYCKFLPAAYLFHKVASPMEDGVNILFTWDNGWGEYTCRPDAEVEVEE